MGSLSQSHQKKRKTKVFEDFNFVFKVVRPNQRKFNIQCIKTAHKYLRKLILFAISFQLLCRLSLTICKIWKQFSLHYWFQSHHHKLKSHQPPPHFQYPHHQSLIYSTVRCNIHPFHKMIIFFYQCRSCSPEIYMSELTSLSGTKKNMGPSWVTHF